MDPSWGTHFCWSVLLLCSFLPSVQCQSRAAQKCCVASFASSAFVQICIILSKSPPCAIIPLRDSNCWGSLSLSLKLLVLLSSPGLCSLISLDAVELAFQERYFDQQKLLSETDVLIFLHLAAFVLNAGGRIVMLKENRALAWGYQLFEYGIWYSAVLCSEKGPEGTSWAYIWISIKRIADIGFHVETALVTNTFGEMSRVQFQHGDQCQWSAWWKFRYKQRRIEISMTLACWIVLTNHSLWQLPMSILISVSCSLILYFHECTCLRLGWGREHVTFVLVME